MIADTKHMIKRANSRYRIAACAALWLSMLLGQVDPVQAQRDIFLWEINLHGANLQDDVQLELPEVSTQWLAGVQLQRSMGRAWLLGLNYSRFHIGESTDIQRNALSLSLAYFWDNGSLLKQRAFIAPFHSLQGGYLSSLALDDLDELGSIDGTGLVALENGLKFRLADRWSLRASHVAYWTMEADRFEDNFRSTYAQAWRLGISFHFGTRRLSFAGPSFDASARFEERRVAHMDLQPISPRLNLHEVRPLSTKADGIAAQDSKREPEPYPEMIPMERDTLPRAEEVKTIRDTIVISRVDTLYLAYRDTLTREAKVATPGDSLWIRSLGDTSTTAMLQRIAWLEGALAQYARRDTLIVVERPREERELVAEDRPGKREKEDKAPKDEPSRQKSEEKEAPAAEPPARDPEIVELLKRQEQLIANQNEMIRQLASREPGDKQVRVDPGRRDRRPAVQPAVVVPVGGAAKSDEERITRLENEVLRLSLLLKQSPPASDTLSAEEEARVRAALPIALPDPATDSLYMEAADSLEVETKMDSLDLGTADAARARAEEIQQRADSIKSALGIEPEEPQVTEEPDDEKEQKEAPAMPSREVAEDYRSDYPAVFLFGLNRSSLEDSYQAALSDIAEDLARHPDYRAVIRGFTDRSGNVDYNKMLSRKRAEAVRDGLLAKGVKEEQLRIIGEGVSEGSDRWSPGDRRVEVELMRIKGR